MWKYFAILVLIRILDFFFRQMSNVFLHIVSQIFRILNIPSAFFRFGFEFQILAHLPRSL